MSRDWFNHRPLISDVTVGCCVQTCSTVDTDMMGLTFLSSSAGHGSFQPTRWQVNLYEISQVFILAPRGQLFHCILWSLFSTVISVCAIKRACSCRCCLFGLVLVYRAQMCKLLKECFLLSVAVRSVTRVGCNRIPLSRKKKKSFKLEGDLEMNRLMVVWTNEGETRGKDQPNQTKRKALLQPEHSLPPQRFPVIILVQFPVPRLEISQRKWC